MIAPDTIQSLIVAATQYQPMEICGLMFDQDRFLRCPNVAADQEHGFEIAHQDYYNAMLIHGSPWATVHSHPNGPANLSGRDCQLLDALELVENSMKMVIVGLKPLQIRIYSKAEGTYQIDWKWDVRPMEAKEVWYATNS
jgi:proteasome lid subunit RPN8/RPN11